MLGFIISFLLLVLAMKIIQRWRASHGLPPGPSGIPLVGMIPWINSKTAHLTLTKWSKEYGPLYSFWNGGKLFVILADIRVIKEALLKQADIFTGRARTPGSEKFNKNHGLVQADGPRWKLQRRFALSTLRDFGLGKPILEHRINEETEYLSDRIRDLEGKPFDIQVLLNCSVSNIICGLVFGQRFDYDDPKFLRLLESFNVMIVTAGSNIFARHNYFPVVRLLAWRVVQDVRKRMREIRQFCENRFKEHEESFSKDEEPEDYIHAFMAAKQSDGEAASTFTDFQLWHSAFDLFIAGTETTATTLRWAILILIHHPEVQDKVRSVMSDLVGPGNAPNLSDRSKLPYIDAVIQEVQRVANLLPLSLLHRTEMETRLDGYRIPKDAVVIPLLWAVHNDPTTFPNPGKFDPNRFIKNGKLVKSDAVIPFSIGKRACLGESLARMELFLFFTSLFARFRFEFADGDFPSSDYVSDRLVGVTSAPRNYRIRAIPV